MITSAILVLSACLDQHSVRVQMQQAILLAGLDRDLQNHNEWMYDDEIWFSIQLRVCIDLNK